MLITRLNLLALGWAINLIVIFKYGFIAETYALLSLCAAYVNDFISVVSHDIGKRVHPLFSAIPFVLCVLFGAIGILKVIIHIM